MRVIKEWVEEGIRISLFHWNNKYLLKFEDGPMEQTFKVHETEILEESDLMTFCKGEFLKNVKLRFEDMGKNLQNQLINL